MKKRLNYILIYMLLLIVVIAGSMEIRSLYVSIQQSKAKLNIETTNLLKRAAEENGKIKNKTTPWMGNFNVRPELIGTYESRTFYSADTTFSYRHKIANIENELNQRNQHFLLLTDQLHSLDIQTLLDSLFKSTNIKAQTAIGITSTGYPQRNLPWSNDTLHMNINGRIHYIMEADFAQIHYIAYLEYSFVTLWKRIEDKNALYLWGIITLITGASVAIVYFFFLKKKDELKEISKEEEVVVIEAKQTSPPFEIETEYIIVGDKKKKLAPQAKQILQMFLTAKEHRIEKTELKKLWPTKNGDSTSNMTSAVKRINDTFGKIGCKSEIITDPENRDFYLLK